MISSVRWINIERHSKVAWRKILTLKKDDSVLFALIGSSYVNQSSIAYLGSVHLFNGEHGACIEKLINPAMLGYTKIKYKHTSQDVSVWVEVTPYSVIEFSILLGRGVCETPMILEEPPIDAILAE